MGSIPAAGRTAASQLHKLSWWPSLLHAHNSARLNPYPACWRSGEWRAERQWQGPFPPSRKYLQPHRRWQTHSARFPNSRLYVRAVQMLGVPNPNFSFCRNMNLTKSSPILLHMRNEHQLVQWIRSPDLHGMYLAPGSHSPASWWRTFLHIAPVNTGWWWLWTAVLCGWRQVIWIKVLANVDLAAVYYPLLISWATTCWTLCG